MLSRRAGGIALQVVWINKSSWRKPGPIVYMGLLNALAFAWNDVATTLFVEAGPGSDTDVDLRDFYGLEPHTRLQIHRIAGRRGWPRSVYGAALEHIDKLCQGGERVLACTRELGCLAPLFALRRRYPGLLLVLHECHDYFLGTRHLPARTVSTLRRHFAERLLLPRTDGLVCLTEYQRALYQQHLPRVPMIALPLGTLPQPIDAELIEARRRARVAAYIGHLHGEKGLERLFALAAGLRKHGIALHAFGGNAAQVEALRAREVGVGATLRLTPFLPPRELHARLAREVSVGLVPLQDSYYNRYLTCPVKALDYLSHGLPVVATDLPSVRAVLGDAGCYTDFDAGETAGQIARLLADAALYSAHSQRCSARADALTWQRRAAALASFAAPMFADPGLPWATA